MSYTKVSKDEFLSYMLRYQKSVGRSLKRTHSNYLNATYYYNGADKRYMSSTKHCFPSTLFIATDKEFEILTKLYEDYMEGNVYGT